MIKHKWSDGVKILRSPVSTVQFTFGTSIFSVIDVSTEKINKIPFEVKVK